MSSLAFGLIIIGLALVTLFALIVLFAYQADTAEEKARAKYEPMTMDEHWNTLPNLK